MSIGILSEIFLFNSLAWMRFLPVVVWKWPGLDLSLWIWSAWTFRLLCFFYVFFRLRLCKFFLRRSTDSLLSSHFYIRLRNNFWWLDFSIRNMLSIFYFAWNDKIFNIKFNVIACSWIFLGLDKACLLQVIFLLLFCINNLSLYHKLFIWFACRMRHERGKI